MTGVMVILIKLILNKLFLVTIIRRKQFLQEIFTKKIDKNIPYVVADEFVSIRDVLKSYLITFQGFRLIRYIKKQKYFILKNCG